MKNQIKIFLFVLTLLFPLLALAFIGQCIGWTWRHTIPAYYKWLLTEDS